MLYLNKSLDYIEKQPFMVIMPPTLKTLEGHIASGAFVSPSSHPFVHQAF